MAADRGAAERGFSVPARGLGRGPGAGQVADHLCVPVSGGQEQHRAALALDGANLGAFREQELHDVAVAPAAGGVKRGPAVLGGGVDIRAGGEQFGDDRQVVRSEGGLDERRIALPVVSRLERRAPID